jgi:hypothetical protein
MLERDQRLRASQLAEPAIVAGGRLAMAGRDFHRLGVPVAVRHEQHVHPPTGGEHLLHQAPGTQRLVIRMRRDDQQPQIRRHDQGFRRARRRHEPEDRDHRQHPHRRHGRRS